MDYEKLQESRKRSAGELASQEKRLFELVSNKASQAVDSAEAVMASSREEANRFAAVLKDLEQCQAELTAKFKEEVLSLKRQLLDRS